MAVLQRDDGAIINDFAAIAAILAPLGVTLTAWPVEGGAALPGLLAREALADEEKAAVLSALDHHFQRLKAEAGYQSQDLVVLHPQLPGLAELEKKFAAAHSHADDEVRYIIEGEGVFGFAFPDGRQVEVTVQAGDYINVPAGTDHWFRLTPAKRVKAVRYFTSRDGWVADYTGTALRFPVA